MPWPTDSIKNIRKNAKAAGLARYEGKPCKKCKHTQRFTCSGNCVNCNNDVCRNYRRSNRKAFKFNLMKSNYGITKEEYLNLIQSQNNCCKICLQPLEEGLKTHIDHCHKTKKVRGILCNHCNLGIGHFKDNPSLLRLAALYCEAV